MDEIKGRKLQTEGQSVPEKCTVTFLTVSLCAVVTYREVEESFAGVVYFLPILWQLPYQWGEKEKKSCFSLEKFPPVVFWHFHVSVTHHLGIHLMIIPESVFLMLVQALIPLCPGDVPLLAVEGFLHQ